MLNETSWRVIGDKVISAGLDGFYSQNLSPADVPEFAKCLASAYISTLLSFCKGNKELELKMLAAIVGTFAAEVSTFANMSTEIKTIN